MINWEKELEKIFEDPLLADVTAPRKRITSSDRLIAIFQEVSEFYRVNGRLPMETPEENSLFHRWKGIIKSEKKIERCRPFDDLGILPQPVQTVEEPQADYQCGLTEEEQLEAILNDPLLADIEDGADLGLFDVPEYMRQRLEARKEAEYVGKRRPCADFDKYAEGFKEIQQGLKSGKYRLVKFEESHVAQGRFFVEQGSILYVAGVEEIKKNKFGRKDGRIRCVYENGSESDILKLTLCKSIYTNGGYSIVPSEEQTSTDLEEFFTVTDKDVESGTIYVLRSKSTRPEIASIKDLYKIGFTVTSVESRIANARNEPTYLCADVEVVAKWKVYNVKSSTFEALIHKLFAPARLQVTVDGHLPKEWFIVPLRVIEEAVVSIIKGEQVMYDPSLGMLVRQQSVKTMKCLSVRQPWAYLICSGQKDVENRSWKPKNDFTGRILIHASSKIDPDGEDYLNPRRDPEMSQLPTSAIIGYVDVLGYTRHSGSEWAGDGPGAEWKWVLGNAGLFKKTVPCNGKLGLYDVTVVDPDNLPETV